MCLCGFRYSFSSCAQLADPASHTSSSPGGLADERGAERIGDRIFNALPHFSLALVVAWHYHLMGGADLKILVVLALINPILVLAAWAGALVYVFVVMVIHHDHSNRYAGVPGFALGIGLFTIGQLGVLITQRLAA